MKTVDLVEVRPGEWGACVQANSEKPSRYWRMWRDDWRLLLAVHIPAIAALVAFDLWMGR